ncbi:maleylpyruvate isomerase N-terminal domain-containing protein [Nonomuraea sp. NPDC002799]
MNDDDIYTATTAERLRLADFLDKLDDGDWTKASLCPGWSVHEVLQHLSGPGTALLTHRLQP